MSLTERIHQLVAAGDKAIQDARVYEQVWPRFLKVAENAPDGRPADIASERLLKLRGTAIDNAKAAVARADAMYADLAAAGFDTKPLRKIIHALAEGGGVNAIPFWPDVRASLLAFVDQGGAKIKERSRVIGTLVGIELLFGGWSLVMLGLAVRSGAKPIQGATAAL
jgi:hypothetical protein